MVRKVMEFKKKFIDMKEKANSTEKEIALSEIKVDMIV